MKARYGKPVVIAETAYPFTAANADSTSTASFQASAMSAEFRGIRPQLHSRFP